MTRKVHIAVMAYDGTLPAASLSMILGAITTMTQQKKWNVSFHYRIGDSILPRARNAEAANFIGDPESTHFVMIDADTICDANDLIRLIEHDADIVGAPYRTRNEPLNWASVRWLHQDIAINGLGLIEVEAIGTGLICVSRKAMQQLWDNEKQRYRDDTAKGGEARPLFWFEVADGHLWGEDIVFCRKWRALGGNVFVDPAIATGHIGANNFTNKLVDWLRDQPAMICVKDVVGRETVVRNQCSLAATINPLVSRSETFEAVSSSAKPKRGRPPKLVADTPGSAERLNGQRREAP